MRIEYLTMYKWDKLEDGSNEKFNYRLDALPWELYLRTKLGCTDIIMPCYLPKSMYTSNETKQYESAKEMYQLRQKKLNQLLQLIKSNVNYNKKVDNEYLYELWISRIFEIDLDNNPIYEIEVLYKELLKNNEINPFSIELSEKKENIEYSKLSKIFHKLKK